MKRAVKNKSKKERNDLPAVVIILHQDIQNSFLLKQKGNPVQE